MKIRKSKKWVEENDPELLEIFNFDEGFEFMEYYITDDEVRYLPNGNEPYPMKSDKIKDLEKEYISMVKEFLRNNYGKNT